MEVSVAPAGEEEEYVTIVFKCNIRKFQGNPYHVQTPFGSPEVISVGDVIAERDDLESDLEDLRELMEHVA